MLSRSRIGQTTSSSELRLGCDVVQYDQYDHFYDLYNLSRRSPIWDSGSITKRMILKMPFTILIMMMMAMMFCFYIQINFSLFNLQFAIILTDAFRQNYFRLFNATDVNNSFPRHLPVLAKSFFFQDKIIWDKSFKRFLSPSSLHRSVSGSGSGSVAFKLEVTSFWNIFVLTLRFNA